MAAGPAVFVCAEGAVICTLTGLLTTSSLKTVVVRTATRARRKPGFAFVECEGGLPGTWQLAPGSMGLAIP